MSRPIYIKQTTSGKIFDILNTVFVVLLIACMLYPFLNIMALAFNDGNDAVRGGIYIWPRKWSVTSFEFALKSPNLIRGAFVSLLRTTIGTVTGVFCSILLGYIVTSHGFMGKRFMRLLFISTMYFSGGMIPSYLLMLQLGLVNTLTVYWLPSLFSAYYMILASSYIQSLPEAIFESARIDGARELQILFQFVIPLCMPILATIAIYIAVGQWNSWFDVNLYSKNGKWDNLQILLYRLLNQSNVLDMMTDQQQISEKMRSIQPQTVRAATTLLVTAPIIIVYPFFQRYFISGMTLGAVKE